jgi:hypothetical protein
VSKANRGPILSGAGGRQGRLMMGSHPSTATTFNPVSRALLCWIAVDGMPMAATSNSGEFPWGTKGNLNRIGDKLRANPESITSEEAAALGIWRASHYHVLNAFNVNLRDRARGLPITVARRHKRRVTIIDKLTREPGMLLSRMDDVAGIRLIFQDTPSLL